MTTAPSAVWVGPAQLRPSRLAAEFYRQEYTELEDQLDRSGHELVVLGKLGRLFTGPFGSKLPASLYDTPNGVPLLRVQNIGDLFLDETDLARIPLEVHEDIHRSKLEPGDLALAKAGRLGALAKIPAHIQECNITQHIIGVRVRADKVRGSYLAAFFLSRFGNFQLKRQGIGTLIKYLGIEETRAAKVAVPGRGVQDYIGAKVELAERCRAVSSRSWLAATELLEAALGAPLTSETFEVKSASNVSGSGYEVTSIRPVAALVSPARLVGAIGAQFFTPRRAKAILVIEQSGLRAKRLSMLADRFTKRVSADEVQARGLSYIGLAQVDSSTGYVSTAIDEQPSSSSVCFGARDILFSKLRPYLNKVAICPEHLEEAAGSTELVTYRTKPGVDPYYLFFVLRSPLVLNQVIDITSGSTHPRVAPDLIDHVLVPLAEEPVQKRIGRLARAALELMRRASLLVEDAKADVEALVEGTLDVQAILSGSVKAPAADDIPELAKDGT
ncbi:hypothetical protein Vqi01_40430 [Micromonospora qiuiae]|uniref:Type I restriction modification DNA specificity domain-containing protein n=1 Tax=Micromonospora qiuiae TaxID=502268 RepID=A0ABQ4JFF9_9ACTN|nr:hypothetical protein [Micromonospora qiuiae]GIJ28881.1 hypothetical protein Vqi01_40430 [Micromonospora qiuiae]